MSSHKSDTQKVDKFFFKKRNIMVYENKDPWHFRRDRNENGNFGKHTG